MTSGGSGDDLTLSAFSEGDTMACAGYSTSLERSGVSSETKDLWVIEVEKSKAYLSRIVQERRFLRVH